MKMLKSYNFNNVKFIPVVSRVRISLPLLENPCKIKGFCFL
nr:MAG TPA: hypothetical protein [Caudoviricetes sp.]